MCLSSLLCLVLSGSSGRKQTTQNHVTNRQTWPNAVLRFPANAFPLSGSLNYGMTKMACARCARSPCRVSAAIHHMRQYGRSVAQHLIISSQFPKAGLISWTTSSWRTPRVTRPKGTSCKDRQKSLPLPEPSCNKCS